MNDEATPLEHALGSIAPSLCTLSGAYNLLKQTHMTNIRINSHKWDFYSLFNLPYYSPFKITYEEVFVHMLDFYQHNKHYTNREITALFSVACYTLNCYKNEYDHDLRRRNELIITLANKYAHCKDKDRLIRRELRWFIPKYLVLQVVIWGRWWLAHVAGSI